MNSNNVGEIRARNDIAQNMIAGFAAVTPALADLWRLVDASLTDLPAVLAELGQVRDELKKVRLDRANLLAAILACLDAQADGDDDFLWYLRDEVDARLVPSDPAGSRLLTDLEGS